MSWFLFGLSLLALWIGYALHKVEFSMGFFWLSWVHIIHFFLNKNFQLPSFFKKLNSSQLNMQIYWVGWDTWDKLGRQLAFHVTLTTKKSGCKKCLIGEIISKSVRYLLIHCVYGFKSKKLSSIIDFLVCYSYLINFWCENSNYQKEIKQVLQNLLWNVMP